MKNTATDIAQRLPAPGLAALTDTDRAALTAKLIQSHGLRCGRVLAVLPTDTPEIWRVSCMQDGAMDSLATYRMDLSTGRVFDA